MNDECEICGCPLLTRNGKTTSKLGLAKHAEAAIKKAESRSGRRDPQLVKHAKRLEWSLNATSTMERR
jgi:hypothetical protein